MGVEKCEENMRLGVVETDSQMLLDILQIGSAVQYKDVDPELREDDDPLSDSLRNVEITTSHYFQPDLQQKGIALVFEDNGACVSINSVQVKYEVFHTSFSRSYLISIQLISEKNPQKIDGESI